MVGTENLNVGHHVVQFYGHDEELAERVTDYLLGALASGGVAIVIATPEHRHEFETRLAQAGVDLVDACARGAYLAMDAAETVRELMAGDQLDSTALDRSAFDSSAFDRVISGLIRRAGAGGRTVSVYGEMVALLWDDGLVSAAAQLEAMWNELGRRHPFSLFCGYRSDSVTRAGYLDAFAEVCRLHQEVVGFSPAGPRKPREPRVVRTFAFSRDAPAVARHFAVGALHDWGAGDLADDVALVVTELAANAIVHAHSGFTIVVSARGDLVQISVRDATPLPGAEPGAALVPARRHGLGVVDALASSWGVESLGSAGKTVWVELRR